MPPKNAAENSKHRDKIDDLLLEGNSSRFISNYLKEEYGELISHAAINRYKNKHLDVNKDVGVKYQSKKDLKTKAKKDKIVNKVVSDLDFLDNIVNEANTFKVDLDSLKNNKDVSDLDHVNLCMKFKRLAIDAVKAKSLILDKNETNFNVNFEGSDFNEEERKSLRELALLGRKPTKNK
jgi:hypothetical protein